MEFSRQIPLPESTYRNLFWCQDEITDLFLRKFHCEVQLRGPELRGYQAPSVTAEILYEKRISGGPVVSVWKDDLTRQDADVVVNAANEDLDHIGGLAQALAKAGGPIVEKESKEFIKRHGRLRTGECAETGPGNLPCRRLLHAVGPIWISEIADKCENELEKCIQNVLEFVNQHKDVKSVAIPAVSSGIFGFPLQLCANIIVKTIRSFCDNVTQSHLKEIRLVNNNDPAVQAMKSACERILGASDDVSGAKSASGNQAGPVTRSMSAKQQPPPTESSNKNTQGQRSSSETSQQWPSSHKSSSETSQPWPSSHKSSSETSQQWSSSHKSSSETSQQWPSAHKSSSETSQQWSSGHRSSSEMSQSISINGLTLHLVHGLIQEQNTAIIVNSVSPNLDLYTGVISNAIRQKAGYQLQEEIRSKHSHLRSANRNAVITMIPTKGYRLPCSFVYHVILPTPSINYDYGYTLQVLSHVTNECLEAAHGYKSPSISFPALGTGNIGLYKQSVAKAMTEAVLKFARERQRQLDVYFVIHPHDKDTYQAFQEQLKFHHPTKNTETPAERRDPRPDSHDRSSHSRDSESPSLIINATNNEDAEEADAWLHNVLHPQPVSIQNNLVLLLGQKEHDVFSSPDFPDVSIKMNLSNGMSDLQIDGPPQDKVRAVLQVERLLLEVQEKHAVTLEEELLETAVIWFYVSEKGARRYPAKANRELEKAFVTQSDITLKSEPHHVISMKNLKAKGKDGAFQLQRRAICDSSKDLQKKRRPEDWLPQVDLVDPKSQEFQDQVNKFKKEKLTLIKMEKIQNRYLSEIFQSKKEAKPSNKNIRLLYQLVPRQFTGLVCEVGFQRIFSNLNDPKCGHGIYFTDIPRRALECFQTQKTDGGPFYIFQAEVLIDSSAEGKRDTPILVPRKTNHKPADILDLNDCLVNSTTLPSIFVIPDSFQAKPLYLFTCRR